MMRVVNSLCKDHQNRRHQEEYGDQTENNCLYQYDTHIIAQTKMHKIEDEFGVSNQIAILVPKGDYESEKKVLKEFETLDYVNTVTGLANVSIKDDYVLTDKIAPRAFSELTDLDIEIVRVLYMAYAYDQGQNGPIFTGIDEYKVPIIDMFLFLYDQYEENARGAILSVRT